MSRVKRGVIHNKRRKGILKLVKGFKYGRKNLIRQAKTAILKADQHSFRDRRAKKRNFRQLWQIKISAALLPFEMSYSKFMGALKKHNVLLDRKVLANLGEKHPNVFKALVEKVK
jgi:large subunit ribosomal protein L20